MKQRTICAYHSDSFDLGPKRAQTSQNDKHFLDFVYYLSVNFPEFSVETLDPREIAYIIYYLGQDAQQSKPATHFPLIWVANWINAGSFLQFFPLGHLR